MVRGVAIGIPCQKGQVIVEHRLSRRICARRRVKASGERRPARIVCRSESSKGRTKVGGFIQTMMRPARPLHKIILETALGPVAERNSLPRGYRDLIFPARNRAPVVPSLVLETSPSPTMRDASG